jgi:hypothetical protein
MVQNFAIKCKIHFCHRIISCHLGPHICTNVLLNLSFRIIILFAQSKRKILSSVIFFTVISFKSFKARLSFSPERILSTLKKLALFSCGVILPETAVVTINRFSLIENRKEMDWYYLPSQVIRIVFMFDHLLRLHLYSVQLQDGLVEDLRQ